MSPHTAQNIKQRATEPDFSSTLDGEINIPEPGKLMLYI
jgi:hypothetical protein